MKYRFKLEKSNEQLIRVIEAADLISAADNLDCWEFQILSIECIDDIKGTQWYFEGPCDNAINILSQLEQK